MQAFSATMWLVLLPAVTIFILRQFVVAVLLEASALRNTKAADYSAKFLQTCLQKRQLPGVSASPVEAMAVRRGPALDTLGPSFGSRAFLLVLNVPLLHVIQLSFLPTLCRSSPS